MKGEASQTARALGAQPSRAVRWAIGVGVAITAAIALVLMFLLTLSTNNRALYERNYSWLFAVNVVVAVAFLGVLVWIVVRLSLRLRRGKFGSRLLVKLAAIFALVALVPGALIYVVSYQFVSRSIESWFDVEVEGALNAGVSLARTTLEMQASEASTRTRAAAAQLAQVPDAAAGLVLERIRDQLGATDAALWSSSGTLLSIVGQSKFQLDAERPGAQQLRMVRQQGGWSQIEGLDDLGDRATPQALEKIHMTAMAVVPTNRIGLFLEEPRFLHVTLPLPAVLVGNAVAVQEVNREYQERALARGGLRRMYIGTLTLSLFLAVFGALLLAVLLGNQLARPLLVLAEGVREVAQGNLSPKAALQGKDELGGLTRSFATMTQQLADARAAVQSSMLAVDTARERLQTILDNLTSGVIVMDRSGRVQSFNPGAERILRLSLWPLLERPLGDVPELAEFARAVQRQFDSGLAQRGQSGQDDHWQQTFELHASPNGAQQHATSLVARGAGMPEEARLLVFEDITEIVSAQRAQAWGEVARRLAHEIKNPLTPIQLSAERLEMKLLAKLEGPDRAMLAKSVKTIVDQVEAMKRLVNEFRDYARLPSAELQPLDLNALVRDVLHLYEPGDVHVPVKAKLDPACPPILGDAQQLRQVLHNLLQNAQDATEGVSKPDMKKDCAVFLSTAFHPESKRVQLTVSDQGAGFPPHILQRAFEPYVTTKTRGTGLGLAVVKKIADEHKAAIKLLNREQDGQIVGAQVSLSFATVQAAAT